MNRRIPFYWLIATLLLRGVAMAQIPVEAFSGDKKTTLDIMFFKFTKNAEGQNSKFLFFNRNRASLDYKMTKTTNLPQFGFTEAFSFNLEKLKGFAPVAVVSILNRGVYPKAGIQYVKTKKDLTVFTWIVAETLKNPNVDFFFLGRYTPKLTEKVNLYTQLELVNAFPTINTNNYFFTQRLRVGLKIKAFQIGAAADVSETGRNNFSTTKNTGVFLRYEF